MFMNEFEDALRTYRDQPNRLKAACVVAADAELKAALRPVKSFCTRHGVDHEAIGL